MQYILPALMGLVVAHAAFSRGRASQNWEIIKTFRFVHFFTSLFVIAVVVGVGFWLYANVPFFDKNPILWVISNFTGSGDGEGGGNVLFSGIQWKLYAVIFLPVLMFALPTLAKREEEIYREGTQGWVSGIFRSVRFGLAHLIMLIPLGIALALSIAGLWFTHQYFKGGVRRSTTYHAAYNTMLVGTLLVVILVAG